MALSELDMMNLWAKQLTGYKSQWERLFDFGYAIEAEVRKQDDALILQLVEALCECAEDSQEQLDRMEAARLRDYKPNAIAWQEDTIAKAKAAIVAGRARLEKAP